MTGARRRFYRECFSLGIWSTSSTASEPDVQPDLAWIQRRGSIGAFRMSLSSDRASTLGRPMTEAVTCSRCGRTRPAGLFRGRLKVSFEGRELLCRTCQAIWWRERSVTAGVASFAAEDHEQAAAKPLS